MEHKATSGKKIALIYNKPLTYASVNEALDGLFEIDTFSNGLAFHYAAQQAENQYLAILSDDELRGTNGAPLLKTLLTLGYKDVPFISLISQIDEEQRVLAMKEGITEIFSMPIDTRAVKIRVPYIIENFKNVSDGYIPNKPFRLPVIKRLFDIFFSGMALLCLSPFFLIIALLIRAESKGKVFYYSLRVGTGYQIFKFYKFRSMFTGADAKLKDLSHLNQYNTDAPGA